MKKVVIINRPIFMHANFNSIGNKAKSGLICLNQIVRVSEIDDYKTGIVMTDGTYIEADVSIEEICELSRELEEV